MANFQFNNKVVLITGAAKGIGQAAALAFAQQGCRLAIVDIDKQGLAETTKILYKQIPEHKPLEINADVSSDEDLQGVVSQTICASRGDS